MSIHVFDDDERQITDAQNYAMNHGSFAEVSININRALQRINQYGNADEAEWVGMCASLNSGFRYKNKRNFIIHVWEATSLPVFVWQMGKQQERIFGLSNQITKLWLRYGFLHTTTIYGGCDTEFWHQTQPKNNQQFQLCHVNSTNIRCGIDLTVQAFARAFAGNKDACLIIKDTNQQSDNSALLRQLQYHREYYNVDIRYHSQREPMTWVRDLYSSSHVTLNVLRATSFGMPLLECGACNSLCVTGDIEPTNELIRPSYGILLPPKSMVKLFEIIPKLQEEWGLLNCYGHFPHIEEPYIADYDIDVYVGLLQDLYKNWSHYSTIDTRTPITQYWSWDASAKKLVNQLYGI